MKKTNLSIASFMLAAAVLSGCSSLSRASSGTGSSTQAPAEDPSGRPGQPPDGLAGGPGGNGGPGFPGADGGPGMPPPGGMASQPSSYDAAVSYSANKTVKGKQIESSGTDENAVHVKKGAKVTLTDTSITRASSSSTGGDAASFYGVGAAALVTDGSLTIKGGSITTDSKGGAGVFAYGDGTAYVADTTITTAQDTSGGIHAAGGGTLYARNLTVATNGESSAAIRSDRGGGTMVVDGGSYTSNGNGSPAIYSTADIAVRNASLAANGSEAICIEGLNSIHLFDCELTGNMSDQKQNDCTWNVILYQSMSGDSQIGNSTFEMQGGRLTAKNGGMFYSTNTESTFILKDVQLVSPADSEFLLKVTGNKNQRGWGKSGANGATTRFTAIRQVLQGNVIYDSISSLDFYLTDGSSFTGRFIDDETAAGKGGDGGVTLHIDSGSSWVVTGDCTLTGLSCAGTIVDKDGKTVSIAGTNGKVYIKGNGAYTVTVANYDGRGDVSGASKATNWSDYQMARF
ncbi:MAG: hypothetical protein II932_07255 [Treponema sp.]|nr:hypothetical protein [Treponema sp.]